MADTSFAVTAGSGTALHTATTSISGTTVHDQVVKQGEPYLASYRIATVADTSIATAAAHIIQVMAGSTLNVYIRRIRVFQSGLATAAALRYFSLHRLTTAGTGGTSITAAPMDTTDAAAGATGMTLPTVKGTEGTFLGIGTSMVVQTVSASPFPPLLLAEWDFERLRSKALRIPAGTANGMALKNVVASAGAAVVVEIDLSEANF